MRRAPNFTPRISDEVSTEASILSHCSINHWVMEGQISSYLPIEEMREGLNEIMKTMQTMTIEFNDETEMWQKTQAEMNGNEKFKTLLKASVESLPNHGSCGKKNSKA